MDKQFVETIANEHDLVRRLIELSKDGRAWFGDVLPFSHTVSFYAVPSPSRFPDSLYHRNNCIGYRGKMVSFSAGAKIREQQRGVTLG